MKHIKPLVQFDDEPNSKIFEAKWEIYKISLSFIPVILPGYTASMKGQNHRVLFQNAEGTINMGVWFDDPEIELSDIFWYNHLGIMISNSLASNEGLCSFDEKLEIMSCYVELHRNGL